jgi:opacity protein-like surface antigen
MGFGYALSYQASMNLSAQFSYAFNTKYTINDNQEFESGSSLASSFNIGTGWRITPARSLYVSLGIGLTNNDSDVSLSIKLPYEF